MWCRSCTLRGGIRPRVQYAFRGQTDRGLWAKGLRIFNAFCDHAQQSIRHVAHQPGCSKSRGHRLTQAMERRDGSPESWWWATAEEHGWLLRLVVAPLAIVGLKRGVGAESISAFVCRLRLASHVGCSPSALRGVMDGVAPASVATTAAWEQEGMAQGEPRPSRGAVAAPCLARLRLGVLDLVSG
jgi:hypothetical protein